MGRHFTGEDVTLYVPCYNASATLGECLRGICSQAVKPREVLLIDDGSEPPVSFAGVGENIKVVRQPRNMGLAAARNKALELCGSALIASLDADVVPAPRWLEKLLEAINRFDVAGVGGRLMERFRNSPADLWRSIHMAQHWGGEPVLNPRFLYGANNIFLKDALLQAGGYNDSLRTNYEDMCVSEVLYAKGFNLYYEPSAECEHLKQDTPASVLKGFWQWYHSKGVLKGDFDSPEGLVDRMERVNFGIFEYRYKKDVEEGRGNLLEFDELIPWVFCVMDLNKAFQLNNFLRLPAFPDSASIKLLSPRQKKILYSVIDNFTEKRSPLVASGEDYVSTFHRCLNRYFPRSVGD